MPALRTRLQYLLSVLSVLLLLALAAVAWGWWQMRGSLAQLDGERAVAGLSAPVKIERDALGVPTITGTTRPDVARALGFLHAQDRFFQMDLLRRSGAGELAEVFGAKCSPKFSGPSGADHATTLGSASVRDLVAYLSSR